MNKCSRNNMWHPTFFSVIKCLKIPLKVPYLITYWLNSSFNAWIRQLFHDLHLYFVTLSIVFCRTWNCRHSESHLISLEYQNLFTITLKLFPFKTCFVSQFENRHVLIYAAFYKNTKILQNTKFFVKDFGIQT